MELILIACEGLRPHIEKLRANENFEADILYYSAKNIKTEGFLQNILSELGQNHGGKATVVIAAGKDDLPDNPLDCAGLNVVFPNIHSYAALLLGSPQRYRAVVEECDDYPLFCAKSFADCGENQALSFISRGHTSIAFLADSSASLPQLEKARQMAEEKRLPYREYLINYTILKDMLEGSFTGEVFTYTQPLWQ